MRTSSPHLCSGTASCSILQEADDIIANTNTTNKAVLQGPSAVVQALPWSDWISKTFYPGQWFPNLELVFISGHWVQNQENKLQKQQRRMERFWVQGSWEDSDNNMTVCYVGNIIYNKFSSWRSRRTGRAGEDIGRHRLVGIILFSFTFEQMEFKTFLGQLHTNFQQVVGHLGVGLRNGVRTKLIWVRATLQGR